MTTHCTDDQALRDRQAQARLERMLAARRAADAAREARFRQLPTPRSQFRASARAPLTDVRFMPSARMNRRRFAWRDAAMFLLPAAFTAAMFLVAHWAGWLP